MKITLILKSVFILLIVIISMSLALIAFKGINKEESRKDEMNELVLDYRILDKSIICNEALELIYENNESLYYLPCIKSDLIYIEWNDGTIDLLKDALNNNKVDIDSLITHNLDVVIERRDYES